MIDLVPAISAISASTARRSVRARWRRLTAALHHVRTAPATFTYLAVLTVTTIVLAAIGRAADVSLIGRVSTNLDQLTTTPLRALVASAFWLGNGFAELVHWSVLFLLVMAPLERRLGTARAVIAFAAGHVGATLATQGVIAVAIASGLLAHHWAHVPDVGASYGFAAVAAVMLGCMPRRWRLPYGLALLAWVIGMSQASSGFTTLGHCAALLIGLAARRRLHRPVLQPA